MEGKQYKFDLEDRLVDFACRCLEVCDLLPGIKAGQNLEYQLSKSSTASALVYGEAQAAESRADFIHKMKVELQNKIRWLLNDFFIPYSLFCISNYGNIISSRSIRE